MVAQQGGGMVAPKKAAVIPGALGGAVGGAGGASQDPLAMLAALTGGGGVYQDPTDNTDYQAQAAGIYAPQTDYLEQLRKNAIQQGKVSGGALDALYKELAANIGEQAGGIKKGYDTAITGAQNVYNEAYGRAGANYDASRNGVADTLARLGQTQALGSSMGSMTQMQGLMQGILTANNQATKNQLGTNKQSMLDYNTAMQGGAKLSGADAQYGLSQQLNGFLNELGLKEADLKSKISEWAVNAQGEASKTAYDRWKDSQTFALQREGMAQEAGQWAGDNQFRYDELGVKNSQNSTDSSKLDPVGAVEAIARASYPNTQAAGNAVKAVMDVIQTKNPTSLSDFYAKLEANNMHHGANGMQVAGDIGTLRRMAAAMWERMYGKPTPSAFSTF